MGLRSTTMGLLVSLVIDWMRDALCTGLDVAWRSRGFRVSGRGFC